jgi:hypothetical protein
MAGSGWGFRRFCFFLLAMPGAACPYGWSFLRGLLRCTILPVLLFEKDLCGIKKNLYERICRLSHDAQYYHILPFEKDLRGIKKPI